LYSADSSKSLQLLVIGSIKLQQVDKTLASMLHCITMVGWSEGGEKLNLREKVKINHLPGRNILFACSRIRRHPGLHQRSRVFLIQRQLNFL